SSFTMMVAFAGETSAASNDPQFAAISAASASLTLFLFSVLLLLFPRNYLSLYLHSGVKPGNGSRSQLRLCYYRSLSLYGYAIVLFFLSVITVLYAFLHNSLSLQLPGWLNILVNSYYVLALTGILATTIFSYRQAS